MDARARDPAVTWAQARERGSAKLIRCITWLACRVPRAWTRLLLYPITAYYVAKAARSREVSYEFLQRALGRPATWREMFTHHLYFARMVLDRVYFVADGRSQQIPMQWSGHEHVRNALALGRGCLLLGSHLGSFEAMRGLAQRPGMELPIRPVMYATNAHKVQSTLDAVNPQLARSIIAAGQPDTMLRVADALQENYLVGLLADRSPFIEPMAECDFLGHKAPFPVGPYRLALAVRVPIVFTVALLDDKGYRIHIEPLWMPQKSDSGDDIDAAFPRARAEREQWIAARAQDYAHLLERYAKQSPMNWFNFYDFWDPAAGPH